MRVEKCESGKIPPLVFPSGRPVSSPALCRMRLTDEAGLGQRKKENEEKVGDRRYNGNLDQSAAPFKFASPKGFQTEPDSESKTMPKLQD
ncbi:unnamed protein product [Protopolystoma xenopodis]|uniref:Uncharacterized protein n=1 Tax=Protopolystoma xenopodis TaxID=117903 RepID=A0A448X5Q8_9PLAT|nr:unnamed protein product [Protopolystoma xenopodis]